MAWWGTPLRMIVSTISTPVRGGGTRSASDATGVGARVVTVAGGGADAGDVSTCWTASACARPRRRDGAALAAPGSGAGSDVGGGGNRSVRSVRGRKRPPGPVLAFNR